MTLSIFLISARRVAHQIPQEILNDPLLQNAVKQVRQHKQLWWHHDFHMYAEPDHLSSGYKVLAFLVGDLGFNSPSGYRTGHPGIFKNVWTGWNKSKNFLTLTRPSTYANTPPALTGTRTWTSTHLSEPPVNDLTTGSQVTNQAFKM